MVNVVTVLLPQPHLRDIFIMNNVSDKLQLHHVRFPMHILSKYQQESLALASMARDDPPASSTASSTACGVLQAAVLLAVWLVAVLLAAMRGKVGSEFET